MSVAALEEPRDRPQLDRRQRDEVVGPDEDVELARVQPADAGVVDGEVEDGEEVAAGLVLGVDVDLRPLAPREDVLDVEGVPAEACGEVAATSSWVGASRWIQVRPSELSSASRGCRCGDIDARRRHRRGAYGCGAGSASVLRGSMVANTGMFAVYPGDPAVTGPQQGLSRPLGEPALERERPGRAREVDRSGGRPEEERRVLRGRSRRRRAR